MKNRMLLIVAILAISSGVIHAQEVFKKHGFTKKPLTFCDGHYNEFFKNKDVVQIGSVLLDTRTNTIVKFLDKENANNTLPAELSSMCIDPHAEKYYSISPYVYCNNNPINKVDPDGKDDYYINNKGQIVRRVENKKQDSFQRVDNKGKAIKGKSLTFKYGTVAYSEKNKTFIIDGKPQIIKLEMLGVKGDENANKIFKFVAGSTQADGTTKKTNEWSKFQLDTKNGSKSQYNNFMGTGVAIGREIGNGRSYATPEMLNEINSSHDIIRDFTHNHPNGSSNKSGPDNENFEYIRKWNNPDATMHIYTAADEQNTPY